MQHTASALYASIQPCTALYTYIIISILSMRDAGEDGSDWFYFTVEEGDLFPGQGDKKRSALTGLAFHLNGTPVALHNPLHN